MCLKSKPPTSFLTAPKAAYHRSFSECIVHLMVSNLTVRKCQNPYLWCLSPQFCLSWFGVEVEPSPPAKTSLMIHRHTGLRVREVDVILLPNSSHSGKIQRYPLLKHFSPILPVFDGAA